MRIGVMNKTKVYISKLKCSECETNPPTYTVSIFGDRAARLGTYELCEYCLNTMEEIKSSEVMFI